MREDFNNILHVYNEHAKDAGVMISKEDRASYQKKSIELTENAAQKRGNTTEVQGEILKIQKSKQNLVRKLHKNFKKIDTGIHIEEAPDATSVTYDKDTKRYYAVDTLGNRTPIKRSEILTDGQWGIAYNMDATVPRILKKEYLLHSTKRDIADALDEQIMRDEMTSAHTHIYKQHAYGELYKSRENRDKFEGFLAEKMIKGLLAKISLEGADFELEDADAYQDVEEKIDFIIRRKNHNRAIGVLEDEKVIGIQFTLNVAKEDHKKKQIEKSKMKLGATSKRKHERGVDDILLVVMPIEKIHSTYKKWSIHKTSGGPEMLWEREEKFEILCGVLKGLATDTEINSMLDLIEKRDEISSLELEINRLMESIEKNKKERALLEEMPEK